ncbi:SIN3 Histone deacetylase complex SIN3 component [Pyrenophora tritici-repentis]|nr:SIN3 Histone deacetylase complex SIN3 component [Pyrenophora tritici-repentis]
MGAVMDDEALELHFSPAFDWIQADFECDNRPNNSNPQGPHASSAQPSGPVLPQPSGGGYYASGAATAHNQNLPALPGLTAQPQHSSPHMSAQRPPSSDAGAQGHQAPPDHVKREAEQRDREHHERQQREHAALQSHSTPMQIHQPVAVAPSTRTIHGPNGLLGQSGPMNGPNLLAPPMGGPNATGQMYGNSASVQHEQTTPRMQHAVQAPTQAQMLMPFAGPPGSMAMGQGQQPILNDALSYLDQVKVQFADHPDVYNRFLDIMKDFKSGAIDTPGVIERVSTLFAGNPALIQGFNTFLPPGYKIECGTNGDPNAIRVTTPMGTMVSTMPAPRPLSPPRSAVNGNNGPQHESTYYETAQGQPWPQQQRAQAEGQESMFSPNNRTLGQPLYGQQQQQGPAPHSPEVTSRPHPDPAGSAAVLAHQQEQRGVSQLQNAVSAATGRSIMSPSVDAGTPLQGQALNGAVQLPQMGGAAAEKRGPVEFNHAISYVNKIKNRFAAHPDIYKNFLEILQTYQRESKPIQDVYAQVTHLFGGAPDLLEDFKQFLPESAAHHRAQQQAAKNAAEDAIMLSNVRGESGYGAVANQQTPGRADTSRLPPMGNFAPTPTANRDNKRKRERQGPVAAPMPTPMSQELPTSNLRGGYTQGSVNKVRK